MRSDYLDLRSLLYELKESSILKTGRLFAPDTRIVSNILKLYRLLAAEENPTGDVRRLMHEGLNATGNSEFLRCLGTEGLNDWANASFQLIQKSGYNLLDMFESRVGDHPGRILFRDMSTLQPADWTYRQGLGMIKEIAAACITVVNSGCNGQNEPAVAIFCENSVAGACSDLACLMYGIPDTPLNIYFDNNILAGIFTSMAINIAVTDTAERCRQLLELKEKSGCSFVIFTTEPTEYEDGKSIISLPEYCKSLNKSYIDEILGARPRKDIRQAATVMFTSGSTGKPKGVSFSIYNIVSKRFARAAAVPHVGIDEVFLCYLPLYHTFGRYLELTGSIYWHGTYVFTGNPSADTLFSLFPEIAPSVFISIPLRWQQLYEKCLEFSGDQGIEIKEAIDRATGGNMKWGLSAAGWLSPQVFRFFQEAGIGLCSGFGMTEATGGITMTPPGRYAENTIGLPLPGIDTIIAENGEMFISGHYVAKYFDETKIGDIIEFPKGGGSDAAMPTGDVFRVLESGYYEIVDRVKDIYKNNKGQTIAPRTVETKFANVPGIKSAFLVGDGKPYNVLFIVPDFTDEILMTSGDTIKREYFRQIVNAANSALAPYERVINFALLDRDFEIEKGELTPKGSFNRKVIAENYKQLIENLYISNSINYDFDGFRVQVPRWFVRDLGILEDDIAAQSDGLFIPSMKKKLTILKLTAGESYIIGNLEYAVAGGMIDLGKFALQPMLWVANPELMSFAPCKEGWDTNTGNIIPAVQLPGAGSTTTQALPHMHPGRIKDVYLRVLNNRLTTILFGENGIALKTLLEIEPELEKSQGRITGLIRSRLEALARHPNEAIRCEAYRILLSDEPTPDYSRSFPAFLESGLTFLNDESIREIALDKMEKIRLELLRKRLYNYRAKLCWPCTEITRQQFESVFALLVKLVGYYPEYYESVRTELISWAMHKDDPALSAAALRCFNEAAEVYEALLHKNSPEFTQEEWLERLVFDEEFGSQEIERIKEVIVGTTFLKQSVMLAFEEPDFSLYDVPAGGMCSSRGRSERNSMIYRIAVNTNQKKHYDMQMVLREEYSSKRNLGTIFWLIAIEGHPFGPKVAPKLGCCRPELGARSMAFHGELSLWEKLRQMESIQSIGGKYSKLNQLRRLFISAMTAFFRGWANSGYKITPGFISPNNVLIPELDFKEGAVIISITGWEYYSSPLSLIEPLVHNFYKKILAHYPWIRYQLDLSWIFDSAVEALGYEKAHEFFGELKHFLRGSNIPGIGNESLAGALNLYMAESARNYYMPLALLNAIDRYGEWAGSNPNATAAAKEDTVIELYRLYDLGRFPEIARYSLYRYTYFDGISSGITKTFDDLIAAMYLNNSRPAVQLIELSDLQGAIESPADLEVFSRLVFPHQSKPKKFELFRQSSEQIALHSYITDTFGISYVIREPASPGEAGQLFRLFIIEKYPNSFTDEGRYFVVTDTAGRVVGGICYRAHDAETVHLDGVIVNSQLKGRGIGSAMLDDFINRMINNKYRILKTHFYLRNFYEKKGFTVDKKWGALVKYLNDK